MDTQTLSKRFDLLLGEAGFEEEARRKISAIFTLCAAISDEQVLDVILDVTTLAYQAQFSHGDQES